MNEPVPADLLEPSSPLTDKDFEQFFDWLAAADFADNATLEPGPAAHWHIADVGDANWAMARFGDYDAEIERLVELRDAYMQRAREWFAAAVEHPERMRGYFAGHLETYGLEERERTGGHVKTVALVNGKITTRSASAEVVVPVETRDEFIAWAETHCADAVKVEKSPLLTPMRKAVSILELPTTIVLSCACIVDVELVPDVAEPDMREFEHNMTVGTAMTCESHKTDALIGKWLVTREVAVDRFGHVVPGVDIEPAHVTAKAARA